MNESLDFNYQTIDVADLELDKKNPRIIPEDGMELSYDEVVELLLKEDVLQLAEEIVERGLLKTLLLSVIIEGGKKIVIDGNRRTLSLKMLCNPNLFKTFLSESQFKKLKNLSNNNSIDLVACHIFNSRESAEKEMAHLHLDGQSIKTWKLLKQYEYFLKKIRENNLTIASLATQLGVAKDRIKEGITILLLIQNIKNDTKYKDILKPENFKADKFSRLLLNPEGKRFLGYDFIEHPPHLVIKNSEVFLERLQLSLDALYNDSDEESNSLRSAQFTSKDRLSFFQSIDSNFLPQKNYNTMEKKRISEEESGQGNMFPREENVDRQQIVKALPPGDSLNDKEVQPLPLQQRSNKVPKGLFGADLAFKLNNPSLQLIFKELKEIPVSQFPNAAHDLLRSFLECSLVEFLSAKGVYNEICKSKEHTPKLSELLTYVIDKNILNDSHAIQVIEAMKVDWAKPYSLQRMNMVNHNKNFSSTESDARAAANNLLPLFRVILNLPKRT